MFRYSLLAAAVLSLVLVSSASAGPPANANALKVLKVPRTDDFKLTGDGRSPAWRKAAWEPLDKRPGNKSTYRSRFKMLYSPTGLYVLFDGEDRKLTATIDKDFEDLWNEDAFEFFLWPDRKADGLL